jgi:hypothetical protein
VRNFKPIEREICYPCAREILIGYAVYDHRLGYPGPVCLDCYSRTVGHALFEIVCSCGEQTRAWFAGGYFFIQDPLWRRRHGQSGHFLLRWERYRIEPAIRSLVLPLWLGQSTPECAEDS